MYWLEPKTLLWSKDVVWAWCSRQWTELLPHTTSSFSYFEECIVLFVSWNDRWKHLYWFVLTLHTLWCFKISDFVLTDVPVRSLRLSKTLGYSENKITAYNAIHAFSPVHNLCGYIRLVNRWSRIRLFDGMRIYLQDQIISELFYFVL